MTNIEGYVDDEVYPVEKSAGGSNAYCMKACVVVGYQPAYCICVNKIQAMQRDDTLRGLEECESAIRHGACPAVAMREEELKAGKAIYYINRVKLQKFNDAQADMEADLLRRKMGIERKAGKHIASVPSVATFKTPPKPASASLPPEENGYAAAINAAMRDLEKKPDPAPVPTPAPIRVEPKPEPKPAAKAAQPQLKAGMSLVELARARLAAKAQAV